MLSYDWWIHASMGQVFEMWHITAAFNSGVAQREVACLYSKCFWNSSTKENLFIWFSSSCHSEPIWIFILQYKMFTLLLSLWCQWVNFGLFLIVWLQKTLNIMSCELFLWCFFTIFGVGQLSAFALVSRKRTVFASGFFINRFRATWGGTSDENFSFFGWTFP